MIAVKSLSCGSEEDLLRELGFDEKKINFEAERFLGKQITKREDDSGRNGRQAQAPVITENPFATDLDDLTDQNAAEDFFATLGNKPEPKKEEEEKQRRQSESANDQIADSMNQPFEPSQVILEQVSRNANWNEGQESLIKKNLLLGNLEYAAEIALKCGRSTVALLIAE